MNDPLNLELIASSINGLSVTDLKVLFWAVSIGLAGFVMGIINIFVIVYIVNDQHKQTKAKSDEL